MDSVLGESAACDGVRCGLGDWAGSGGLAGEDCARHRCEDWATRAVAEEVFAGVSVGIFRVGGPRDNGRNTLCADEFRRAGFADTAGLALAGGATVALDSHGIWAL